MIGRGKEVFIQWPVCLLPPTNCVLKYYKGIRVVNIINIEASLAQG